MLDDNMLVPGAKKGPRKQEIGKYGSSKTYRKYASKRPYRIKRPGVLFLAKTGKIKSKRPLSRQKCEKRPGHTVNAPPTILGG